jgi:hypothetical protein
MYIVVFNNFVFKNNFFYLIKKLITPIKHKILLTKLKIILEKSRNKSRLKYLIL